MGLGGISVWQLLIVLLIAIMIFGSGRIRALGSDLGEMVKGLRSGFSELEELEEESADES